MLASALWWGSLTATGFLAVPLLFAHADSPRIAGSLAARLFEGQSWLSLACAGLLLLGARQDGTPRMDWAQGALVYVLLGMLGAFLQQFAVAPRIEARENLQLWHSAGTALYAVQWLCALVVLWRVGGLSRSASS
nr:DUF4149 domain-containing protein [Ramlibacter pallidus]